MNRMSTTDKLAINKFELDEDIPHIIIHHEKCNACQDRPCLFVCSADLYSDRNSEIFVDWGGCLECGTCQNVCPHQAIEWVYPRGTYGISYRYG